MNIMSLLIILLVLSLIGFITWYNTPTQKGKRGEKYVSKLLSQLPNDYIVLNDLVYYTSKGTTQIDHVVLSKHGVFAIETKNYRGEIYGDDDRKEWTQIIVTEVRYSKNWYKTYTYVTKNHFYNPIKQAYSHVYKLKELLSEYPHLPIIPVVVFAGSADLSNVNCHNHVIYENQLPALISNYKSIYLRDDDLQKIQTILLDNNKRQIVDNKTHVKNIRKTEQEYRDKINSGICPKCGGQLIKRTGPYGSFYGCSNYPSCKYTL